MKKIIIVLICCAMLASMISCDMSGHIESEDMFTEQYMEKYNDIYDTNIDTDIDSDETTSNNTNDSPQLEFYRTFQETINSNAYDKWLKAELSKANRSDKEIYAEYLAFWKNELTFTIECGKSLFDDVDAYNQWKYNLEQWVVFSQETLKLEMNSFDATMPQLEVIIPHCELIRQKVIDTKHFLYYLEFETTGNNREIDINWSPIAETLNS